ncbi:hypothetical protein ACFSCV_12375 [Methylopila henanensis]|uniref:Flagellin n=1 Tax=Methylopila henanensis TaxID=873516 RepID=A0ABW4KB57_9HYPH
MSTIGPYSATGVGRPSLARTLSETRSQLDDLLTQLATQKKSSTYAGLGAGRTTSLAMRARLEAIESYDSVGKTVSTRINMMSTALTAISNLGSEYKTVDPNDFQLTSGGVSIQQAQARTDLQEAISYLNTEIDGRYLFSGRSTDVKPVLSADKILADDGEKAGLRTVIDERRLADLGSDGRGRIDVSELAGGAFSVSEEASGPFGLKIASLSSTMTGATATGPEGDPAAITLGVSGAPNDGEQIRIGLTLPDGTSTEITLTARVDPSATLQGGDFRVGATPEETAANMRAAFDAALAKTADTALVAASAMQAGEEFFNTPAGAEPARVAGYDGAYASDAERIAALQNASGLTTTGTAARTVDWYQGEDAGDDPRNTAAATVADGVTVGYGARANEDGTRRLVQTLAVFSSMTFSSSDANAQARYSALASRTATTLGSAEATADVKTIATGLAGANSAIKAASERHTAAKAIAEDAISGVEAVDQEEVSLKILSLQTSLQASYQVTSTLRQLSLVNFL